MNHNKETLFANDSAGLGRHLVSYLELGKMHLCLYIGMSAVFGHVVAKGFFHSDALMVGFFIFILAAGASVLNNIQDREYDRFFVRTFNRSLPKGRVPLNHASILAFILIVTGLSGLKATAGLVPFLLGLSALVCYNVLYTPMKKRTFMAMVPGSLCGMIVPAVGWTAAKGFIGDPVLLSIMTVFGLWQMAHFFIILINTHHKMRNMSGKNRFVNFYTLFSGREIKYQVMIWTGLYALSLFLYTIKGSLTLPGLYVVMVFNGLAVWTLLFWVVFKKQGAATLGFAVINLSIMLFMGTGLFNAMARDFFSMPF